MSEITYKGARFYKCALQVNPCSYASYRGEDVQDEDAYNKQILENCRKNKIEVVGLADHGKVESSEELRNYLQKNDIVVFPGFEIASSENIHMVCLYPENTSIGTLNKYLGQLTGANVHQLGDDPTHSSELSCQEIAQKILKEQCGFWYAAHMTGKKGFLRLSGSGDSYKGLWKKENLVIAGQIPGDIEGLDVESQDLKKYKEIIENKNFDYKRKKPIAIINARDVAVPSDIKNQSASCLIKMTNPTFESFSMAFRDPESRIRLNHDISPESYSIIKSIKWQGADFFKDSSLRFSKNLNAIIGGRGSGKSTLIETIRYVLDLPIRQNDTRTLESLLKNTIGESRIVVEVTSKANNGECYIISRRYGEWPVVASADGELSNLTTQDLLPDIELLGQNEILEIEKDEDAKLDIVYNFLPRSANINQKIIDIQHRLSTNRQKFIKAKKDFDRLDEKVAREPVLKEQAEQFKKLGIEGKLKTTRLLENEKNIRQQIDEQFVKVHNFLEEWKYVFNLEFFEEKNLDQLPNQQIIQDVKEFFVTLEKQFDELARQGEHYLATAKNEYAKKKKLWEHSHLKITEQLRDAVSKLPAESGKSGAQLAKEYKNIVQQLTALKEQKTAHEKQKTLINSILSERVSLLEEYRQTAFDRFDEINKASKKLNKDLGGKLEIKVKSQGNLEDLKDFLKNINGIGTKRIEWLDEIECPDLAQWAKWIKEKDVDSFMHKYKKAGLSKGAAQALINIEFEDQLELEEIELKDVVEISLNVSHEKSKPNFVPTKNLSMGQKCTAILDLLLLNRDDPLIIDQPEDNLDNAFIADHFVHDLRKSKTNRQFIFATHNANIPVFGDAELIAVLDGRGDDGPIQNQGSIDEPTVREPAANILEGGQAAFNMRKDKYGY